MVVTSKPDDGRRRTGGREEVMVAVVDGKSIIQTPVVLRAFFFGLLILKPAPLVIIALFRSLPLM